jgi:DNA-binding XRE family transcriptional regulator
MKLRNHLNRILYERGLAEGELASVCRLDQGHLNRIKNGRVKPSLITALRIGNALGLSVNRIFFLDGSVCEELGDADLVPRRNARATREGAAIEHATARQGR